MHIEDGFLHMLLADGYTKEDVKLLDDSLGREIQGAYDSGKELMVTIVAAMGEEAVISYKEAVRISLRLRSIASSLYLCSPTSPKCLTSSTLLDSRALVPFDRFILPGSPCIWLWTMNKNIFISHSPVPINDVGRLARCESYPASSIYSSHELCGIFTCPNAICTYFTFTRQGRRESYRPTSAKRSGD